MHNVIVRAELAAVWRVKNECLQDNMQYYSLDRTCNYWTSAQILNYQSWQKFANLLPKKNAIESTQIQFCPFVSSQEWPPQWMGLIKKNLLSILLKEWAAILQKNDNNKQHKTTYQCYTYAVCRANEDVEWEWRKHNHDNVSSM